MKLQMIVILLVLSLTLVLMSCQKTTKPEDTPNVLDANTIVLSDAVMAQVQIEGSNLILPMNAETAALAEGKFIVGKPTATFPHGFLYKITGLDTILNESYILSYEPASLAEALKSGYVAFSQVLSPDRLASTQAALPGVKLIGGERGNFQFEIDAVLYDEDGNTSTTDDQVTFSGTADLDVTLAGYIHIRDNQLKGMRFTAKQDVVLNANVSNSVSFFNVNQDVLIFSQPFQPVIVYFGVFPLVLTPTLEVKLNLAGNAMVNLTMGYQYTNTATGGIEFKDNAWNPIHTITENASSSMANPLAFNVSYKASLKPEVGLLFYGIIGPSVAVGAFGEIIVDPAQTAWWQLWAGFFGQVSINTSVLFDDSTRLGPWELFNTRFLVVQSTSPIQGTLSGLVKDAVTQQGLSGVSVSAYKNNDLVGSGTSDAQGQFSFDLNAGTGYRVTFTKEGYYAVNYNNVNVPGNQVTNLETIMQIDLTYTGTGTINGYIYNALNGQPVDNVNLVFRAGVNTQTGNISGDTTTNSSGFYTISMLNTGNFTVEASRADYVTTYFNVVVIGGQTISGQNGVITPVLDASEIRIVLTWGASPSDLDSHITGPHPGGGRFHVYYAYSDFSYNSELYCSLDYDDVSSYGPETITIYNQTGGLYRYSVHDYTNRYSTSSYALSNSSATVRVYFGSTLVQTFHVPTNEIGTLWTVFELFDNQIVPKNIMSNESNPGDITKGNKTDGALLLELPQK